MATDTVTMVGKLDPRGGWEASDCAIARAMDVVGTRSAFLLMREAFYGTTRFDEFAQRAGISEPVAAARLKELVDLGLLDRHPYQEPGRRTRLEYRLTDMGVDLFPALVALHRWGDRWLTPAGVEMQHRECGAPVRAELRCEKGHPLTIGDVDLVALPRTSHSTQAHINPDE
ncbi:MAG TPA: helix-turn-helix domain-containing protein [Trebonia sp.]|jgi:DNA-binding HxlR family transcriptional regulator|nr:helix-turn-helix domain-containing protein [Trebonia sp.]